MRELLLHMRNLIKHISGSAEKEWYMRIKQQVLALDGNTAQSIAEELLADQSMFYCENAEATQEKKGIIKAFGVITKDFLAKHKKIEGVQTEFRIDRSNIRPAESAPGMWIIGEGIEHSYVLVKHGLDKVYIADESESISEKTECHPNIYYCVVMNGKVTDDIDLSNEIRKSVR